MSLDTKALVGELNAQCRRTLETAAQSCVAQTHFTVELEHVLYQLLSATDTDLRQILRYYEVDIPRLLGDLVGAIDKFKRGNARTPTLAPQITELLEEAWLV